MTRLGIVIVHYQSEALLAECLERLQASTLDDFSVRIVDCGSDSGLEDFIPDDPRFRLISPGRNLGFAAGANSGIRSFLVPPDLLLSLNPDVMVEPDTVAGVVDAMTADPEIGAATCKLTLPSGSIDPACRRSEPTLWSALTKFTGLQRLFPESRRFGRYNLTWLSPDQTGDVDAVSGAFLMVRREALEAIGSDFDERFFLYGEDLDLCRRIRRAGFRIRYVSTVQALHIKGSGRIRTAAATRFFYQAMWLYYRKWGRFRTNLFVLAALLVALVTMGSTATVGNALRKLLQPARSGSRR